jgi:hypothetical protein
MTRANMRLVNLCICIGRLRSAKGGIDDGSATPFRAIPRGDEAARSPIRTAETFLILLRT